MNSHSNNILQILFNAILELKEQPEAKECIEYVNDFLNHISNENILNRCSISWDDTNKGFLLLWDDVLPNYLFKADIMICKDYYHYNFEIRDRDGNYLGSDVMSGHLSLEPYYGHSWLEEGNGPHYDKPFWRNIVSHLEEVYQ